MVQSRRAHKVVLVNPPPRRRIEAYDQPDYGHLGLAYLAAVLRDNGCSVDIVDAKLERLTLRKAVSRVVELKPDIMGVTAMTHEICYVAQFAREVKRLLNGLFVVVGGSHVTVMMAETLKEFAVFDCGVYEEGEETLLDLVRRFESGEPLSGVRGLIYRDDFTVRTNPPRPYIEDLDALPLPAWDLYPRQRLKEFVLLTARGCPFQCNFCRPLGHVVRERSPENVIEELQYLADEFDSETRYLWVWDETFGVNRH